MKKLMNEELNLVTGGSLFETVDDCGMLCWFGELNDYHNTFHMIFHWNTDSAEVDRGWYWAGVRSVTKFVGANEYYLLYDGEKISREEALLHI